MIVVEDDFDRVGVLDDVIVRNDVPVGADDEAGTDGRTATRRIATAFIKFFEELAEGRARREIELGSMSPFALLRFLRRLDCHDGRQQTLRQIGEPVGRPARDALDGAHAKRAISGRTNKNLSSPDSFAIL